jgi:hypothetical protein
VVAEYRSAGYDFVAVTDHFEAEYGWKVTDTRTLSDADFVTLQSAELSSAAWEAPGTYWVAAVGLPPEFVHVRDDSDPLVDLRRARETGAWLVLLHPGLNHLQAQAEGLSQGMSLLDAVEIYTHAMTSTRPDQAHGAYFLDALLESGTCVNVVAADDAHFHHARDRFGAWVEVLASRRTPDALLTALRAGHYYSTQAPVFDMLALHGHRLQVEARGTYALSVTKASAPSNVAPLTTALGSRRVVARLRARRRRALDSRAGRTLGGTSARSAP